MWLDELGSLTLSSWVLVDGGSIGSIMSISGNNEPGEISWVEVKTQVVQVEMCFEDEIFGVEARETHV